MNHKKNLRNILILSFILSCLGFILDLGERVPNILDNIKDIVLMTVLIFVFTGFLYSIIILAKIGFRQLVK